MSTESLHVVVAGAGAAGTLAAARLSDAAARSRRRTVVEVIDPAPDTGRGLAYSTPDPRHLLNVSAGQMSALPHTADDFVRWLSDREGRAADPGAYVARGLFGAYLAHDLDRSTDAGRDYATIRRRHDRVMALDHLPATGDGPAAAGVRLRLRDGGTLDADAVVLALGNLEPATSWLPPGLDESPGFVADPWCPGALAEVPTDRDVLLVGTGLTMCDIARTLLHPDRTVHAVSRHGMLPRPHAATSPTAPTGTARPVGPPGPTAYGIPATEPCDLAALKRAVRYRAARYRRLHGDWRHAIDELRPHIPRLWQQLSFSDQQRFLATEMRDWEVHRHRLPPATAQALTAARRAGLLTVRAAEVVGARPGGGREITVRQSDGRALTVGAVVNCTGTEGRVERLTDPLVRGLLRSGLAAPGPHGLGFDTAPDGRLIGTAGRSTTPVWTLGPLRRGNLWETTAIGEIRVQAGELATRILDRATRTAPR
ncbi:FAD/NAD(P)-binding protein [Streptomyces sp. NPDC057555]|uniref:FAD/NAD(P)-binding protein n=1 Tax=Streptomyces sp. NPDC057555 TaxID=3346166 RepID=UPI0036C1DDD0